MKKKKLIFAGSTLVALWAAASVTLSAIAFVLAETMEESP
jgi:hypothetical protein